MHLLGFIEVRNLVAIALKNLPVGSLCFATYGDKKALPKNDAHDTIKMLTSPQSSSSVSPLHGTYIFALRDHIHFQSLSLFMNPCTNTFTYNNTTVHVGVMTTNNLPTQEGHNEVTKTVEVDELGTRTVEDYKNVPDVFVKHQGFYRVLVEVWKVHQTHLFN